MNWNAKDVELFLKEKEYIDTAVIPLLPISVGNDMKHTANQGEFIHLLATQLEKQFKGRMLFFPPFTYMDDPEKDQSAETLKDWGRKIKESGFSFVFFLTSDKRWLQLQNEYQVSIFYVPAIPLGSMDETYKYSLMEDQLKELMGDIIRGWQRVE